MSRVTAGVSVSVVCKKFSIKEPIAFVPAHQFLPSSIYDKQLLICAYVICLPMTYRSQLNANFKFSH